MKPTPWWSTLSDAGFGLFPKAAYAAPDKVDCAGVAIVAKELAAAARSGGPTAFTQASFTIPCGCRTALIGPNGSGKSTLLRVLAGLLPVQAGAVQVLGSAPRLGRTRVAFLAQRPRLTDPFPLQVRRLVQMGTYAHHGWFEECHHGEGPVERALDLLGLTALAERQVHTLSGGQLQRALLARAAVQGAEILLLDEPFAALDQESREIVERFLFAADAHFTVVMATHEAADLPRFDRILALRQGQLTTTHACHGHPHRHG